MTSDGMPERRRVKLPHGEGTIFWIEAEGCWAAEVSLGRDPVTGRRLRRRVRGAEPADVLRQIEEVKRERERGLRGDAARLTVGEYLDYWLEEIVKPRARPGTYDRYRRAVALHLAPGLGHLRLARLRPEEVQRLLNALGERGRRPRHEKELARGMPPGLAPRSVQFVRAVLRRALGQALARGYVTRNVAALVEPPEAGHYEATALDEAGARALLAAAAGHRLGGLVTIALCLGLRQGEALGLSWTDVDLAAGTVLVRRQLKRVDGKPALADVKSPRSRRALPLPGAVRAALVEHQERQATERRLADDRWREWGLVFATTVGTPWSPRNLTRAFHGLLDGAGLAGMRWHDLRHSAGSLLHAQGVDLPTIMAILGHSQISVTANTYLHLATATKRAAAAAMDRAVATPAPPAAGPRGIGYRSGYRRAAERAGRTPPER